MTRCETALGPKADIGQSWGHFVSSQKRTAPKPSTGRGPRGDMPDSNCRRVAFSRERCRSRMTPATGLYATTQADFAVASSRFNPAPVSKQWTKTVS